MIHGGDLLSYEKHYDGDLIDFSSNINPLGMPKGLEDMIIEQLQKIEDYPDIKYRKLKKSLANYLLCEEEQVLVGNGAVDLIDSFTKLAKRVLTMTPAFSEYEERALVHGKEVVSIEYNEDFTINMNALESLLEKDDLLILGNPNNPTGLRIDQMTLVEIYRLIRDKEALLVLDEAFFEFAPQDYDGIEIFKEYAYKNLGIIRAATKFFALPGLRLGYGCTSLALKEKIEKIQMPWRVNYMADLAGQFIFSQKDYIEESKRYIAEERDYLLSQLVKIDGIRPYETHSNYILIQVLKWDEEYVFNFFLKKGIVIRKCSSFKVLGHSYVRVAIKDRKNNIKLIKTFEHMERGRFFEKRNHSN